MGYYTRGVDNTSGKERLNMKKVMITVTTLFGGGAERVVSVWANQLTDYGYDVSLLLYGRSEKEYPISNRVKIYTVADNYTEYKKLGYFKRLRKMRLLIKEAAPDVLINFLPRMQIWVMFATFGMKLSKIETVRVSPWEVCKNSKIEKMLWKTCFSKAKAIIVQTAEQADFFSSKVQKKCVVIPNPISSQYRDNPKLCYADKVTKFVAAGRITEQKNYPLMIEAFNVAKKDCPQITLSIYGTGEESYISKMQHLIDERGLSDSVKLMGRTTDMLSVLQNADAFLMTSDFEGMPNALAEAMVIGLPCISTNCRTGPKDMIEDQKNGYLTQVGDVDSVADAIMKVAFLNQEKTKQMGIMAREKILEMCSEENSLNKLIKMIES